MKGIASILLASCLLGCTASEGDVLLRRPPAADAGAPADLSDPAPVDLAGAELPVSCVRGSLGPGLGCLALDTWGRVAEKECLSHGQLRLVQCEPQSPCGSVTYQTALYLCCP